MFKHLDSSAIDSLLKATTYKRYAAGDVVCREGDVADRLFVIVTGTCGVTVSTGDVVKPLRLATRLAFISLAIAGLMAVHVFQSLILYQTVAGWASVVLAISFFSGVQLLTLGILGEYVGRLYIEAKDRPLYFVSEDTREATPTAVRKLA